MKVLLVRAESTPDDDARAMIFSGLDVTTEPYITVSASGDGGAASRANELIGALCLAGAWLIVTSAAATRALDSILGSHILRAGLERAITNGASFAAVGPTAARSLTDLGVRDVIVPERAHTAAALLESLSTAVSGTAILPLSSIGDSLLPSTLRARGWQVVSRVVYETSAVTIRPISATALAHGAFDALVLRSPSAARAVAHFAGSLPRNVRVVAGGPTTALAAQRLGIHISAVATNSQADSITACVLKALEVGT